MKLAADFRSIARDVLRGKWKIAALVGIVATILGAVEVVEPKVRINIDVTGANASFEFAGQKIVSTGGGANSNLISFPDGSFGNILIAIFIMGAIYFVLRSIILVGYAKFNLNLVDRCESDFANLFAYFSYWRTTAAARFLQMVYVWLWSVLLIIPGIMAAFSYAMTGYILAENPELSAGEAISRSKQMMEGNRWRLFCLEFSFIGWNILCVFTLGIGNFWLIPYKQAAIAAFYRDVSGTEQRTYESEW